MIAENFIYITLFYPIHTLGNEKIFRISKDYDFESFGYITLDLILEMGDIISFHFRLK